VQPPNPRQSDFRSGTRFSAWWIVRRPDGPQLCAIQGRSFMRQFKRSLLIWPFSTTFANPSDDGAWDAGWTTRFYAKLLEDEGWPASQIPFAADSPRFTRAMLQLAIWWLYYRHATTPDAVVLPAEVALPEYGVAPANDGMGDDDVSPACVPVSAARAANPNTAALGLGWHLPPLLIPALGAATLGGLLIWSLTRKSP
jgi:hypothetical protein